MAGFYGLSRLGGLSGGSRSHLSSKYSAKTLSGSRRKKLSESALMSYYNRYTDLGTKKSAADGKRSGVEGVLGSGIRSGLSGISGTIRSAGAGSSKIRSERQALSEVRTKSMELADSAAKLARSGRGGVFSGGTYDKAAAFRAVSDFAGKYNDTLKAMEGTSNSYLADSGKRISMLTDMMGKALAKAGVHIDSRGSMSVDEGEFEKADEDVVRELFSGNGSYAAMLASSASRAASQAGQQMYYANVDLYGGSGYYNHPSAGSFYNSYF